MSWRKLGLVFAAREQYPWMISHAANPTAEVLDGGRVRVYFSTRDSNNRSHIAAAVMDLDPSPRLVELGSAPLVAPGPAGSFDDSGVSMGCLSRVGDSLRLYYVGWNLGVTVPWRNSIGLAASSDGGRTFVKASPAPILDRHPLDPYSLSYPWILQDSGKWRMWYGSNLRWGPNERDMEHVIKYAESDNGLDWRREGRVAVPLAGPDEYAIARPTVLRDRECYRMWFAHRGASYRLGYAESANGLDWRRDDAANSLGVSPGEWDAEMITYPCVFDCAGARYLLYNGNRYGKSGFGIAVFD